MLNGMALVLLDLPVQLRHAVLSLRKMLDDYHPNNGITHVLVNDAPVRSTSGDNVMESGVVFFSSTKATWALLDRVEVVLRTEDGPLELRRGYLPLGPQKILVEGVVTWGAGKNERPAPTPTAAPAPAVASPPTEQQRQQQKQQEKPQAQPQPQPPTQQPPQQQQQREQQQHPQRGPQDRRDNTVVVALHLKELYSRHRNVREETQRAARGDRPTAFPLTPFMIYQVLASECKPRKILFIDAGSRAQERRSKVLVELESEEVAAHVIRVFTRRTVEFVSEAEAPRHNGENGVRRGEARVSGGRICAEVRYSVNAFYSTPNGQPIYQPSGQRNFHRTITVSQRDRDAMNVVDPKDAAALSVLAPREWQADNHGTNPNQLHVGGDSKERYGLEEHHASRSSQWGGGAGGGPSGGAAAPSSSTASQRQHARDDRHGHERRVSPHRSRNGRRSRTSSPSRSYTSSRSRSLSSSRSWSSSSQSSSSSRARHFRRRPRREEVRREGSRHGSSGRHDRSRADRIRRDGPAGSSAAYTSSAAATAGRSTEEATRPKDTMERVQSIHAAAASSAPPPPPPPPVVHDTLPPGWRPIFSEEYQQTYYAYRHPETGVETTTWERPAA